MKKFVAVLLAAIMLLSLGAALAEYSQDPNAGNSGETLSSKTIKDVTKVEPAFENPPPAGQEVQIEIKAVVETDADMELLAASNAQLEVLRGSPIPAYYAPDNQQAFAKTLEDTLGTKSWRIYEFWPVTVTNYKAEYGDALLTCHFATLYPDGEKVVCMIGFYNEDGTVEWTEYTSEGQDDGSIAVVLEKETLLRIQSETALVSVISRVLDE